MKNILISKQFRFVVFFMLILIVVALSFYFYHYQRPKRILFFSVYSADTTDGTKIFELYSDRTVTLKNGIRDSKNVLIEPLIKTVLTKKYRFRKDEFKRMQVLVKELNQCGRMVVQEGFYNDVFEVMIVTDSVRVNRYLIDIKNKCDLIISDMYNLFDKSEPSDR